MSELRKPSKQEEMMIERIEKTIEAAEDVIDRILGDHTTFYAIPDYQRPYSWTVNQVEQLWGDLEYWLSEHKGAPVEQMTPYFLGSIVLTNGDPVWEVIDGQQRLTTLSILLSVARSFAPNKTLRDGLAKYLEGEQDMFNNEPPPLKLKARNRDAKFWEQTIIRQPDDFRTWKSDGKQLEAPQNNMVENAKWLAIKYAELNADAQKRLLEATLKRCYMVVVKTRDMNTAMRTFQVLNDRGLDLRAIDILKASILGQLGETERANWTGTWEDAEADLGRVGFEALFSHLRLLLRRKRQESTLVREIEDEVKKTTAKEFLEKHLRPAISAYRIIRESEYEAREGAEVVNDHLTALGLLDNQDWEPIAIRLVQLFRGDSLALGKTLRRLEARAYWSLLRRDSVHARIFNYISILSNKDNGASLGEHVELNQSEKKELFNLLDADLYLMVRARRPILLLLNRLVSDDGHWMVPDKVTVEHVLPQNPSEGSQWWSWYSKDAHDRWIHKLGNLLLLSRRRNTVAGNRPFGVKKTKYFLSSGTSPFPLTSQVLAENDWTEETLRKRHERLKELLSERWELEI